MESILITGCSSGFGRALTERLLDGGKTVIATMRHLDRRANPLEPLTRRHGDRLIVLSLDVTSASERAEVCRFVNERLGGKLDALINNAGYGLFGALEAISEEQLRHQFEVNFFGLALLTRELLPALRAARGRIINLSSAFGFAGFPLTSAYCASKFAVEGLSEALAYELRPHGVQVAILEPGGHRTKFGENVQWGIERVQLYDPQTKAYRALLLKLMQRKPVPADKVVEAAVRLLASRRMPLRCRVGMDSGFMYWLKRFLPSAWTHALLGRLYDRMFANPKELRI